MAQLTKPHFLANLKILQAARFDGIAGGVHGFYDAEFLQWLKAEAARGGKAWRAFSAFGSVADKILRGPLSVAAVQHAVADSKLAPGLAAGQITHRFHGLMAAFSPSTCFDDPGRAVSGDHELIRSSEADHFRCQPFAESIRIFVEQAQASGSGPIDVLDAGCGPHLFWSLQALRLSDRVRVCAIERNPELAAHARTFAAAFGLGERIHVIEADATSAAVLPLIGAAFAGAAQPFAPGLIVSETHSALMLGEAGDQVLRNLHQLFPTATLVPEGVEIVGGRVDAQRVRALLASSGEDWFLRVTGIAALMDESAQISSLGVFLARDPDQALRLDAKGRRLVGPLVQPTQDGRNTPVFGTRLLFPLGVAALESGHSLGITEWLWALPAAPTLPNAMQDRCHLSSVFMSRGAEPLVLEPHQRIELAYAMGAQHLPFAMRITSTSLPVNRKAIMQTTVNPAATSYEAGNASAAPVFEITTSRHILSWLAEQKLSMVLTTYQIGKLFLLGLKGNGELSIFERTFNRCMGLCPTPNGFYMSSLHQVWRFENLFRKGEMQDGYDRLYVPQVGNTTGDIDIHDMAVDADGRLIFVNTLFGCLATLSETHSFKPLWRPPFLSKLAAEDRCHLNGLAMKDGRAAYVTLVGESDVVDGWRQHRAGGGIVMDVNSNDVVARGLSMPHSPRWHQGKLWLLNSGTGEFGHIELDTGRFVPVTFCAGYMRGLYFHGDYALIGTSKSRKNRTFSGLALDDAMKSRKAEARCGVQIVDLRTGDAVHWLAIEGVVDELYDVITLPGVRCPMALGFKTDEIGRVLSIEE
jgi:uncharacterized protein (TIGR03032 family)